MTLDLTADAPALFTDFSESVRFRVSSAGDIRTIAANVNRQPVADDQDGPFSGTRSPTIHVMLRNHATLGVLPSEVVTDASEVEVAFPVGGTARWRPVIRVVRANTGCVLLEVQA